MAQITIDTLNPQDVADTMSALQSIIVRNNLEKIFCPIQEYDLVKDKLDSLTMKCQQQVDISYFRELRYLDGCFITRCFEAEVEFARFIVSKDGYSILVSNCYQDRSVNPTIKHTRYIFNIFSIKTR